MSKSIGLKGGPPIFSETPNEDFRSNLKTQLTYYHAPVLQTVGRRLRSGSPANKLSYLKKCGALDKKMWDPLDKKDYPQAHIKMDPLR